MTIKVTHRGPSVGLYKPLPEIANRSDGTIIVQYERNDRPHRVLIPATQRRGLYFVTAMDIVRWVEGAS